MRLLLSVREVSAARDPMLKGMAPSSWLPSRVMRLHGKHKRRFNTSVERML
jgi:hypothetical protein